MKIDPIFPASPVINPPFYKFKPNTTSSHVDPDMEFIEPESSSEERWPNDVKVFLGILCILSLAILFS